MKKDIAIRIYNMYIKYICSIFEYHNPKPRTELYYLNNFTLLVAILLSARAMDKVVNQCTVHLFAKCHSPQSMIDIGYEEISKFINKICFFRNKAKYIIATSHILVEQYDSLVPNDFSQLIQLPGIHRKSANVILNAAFHLPTIAVDTHVFRVARRLGLSLGNNVLEVELDLLKITPIEYKDRIHNWLVLHGRYICVARKPKCQICVISQFCSSVTNI